MSFMDILSYIFGFVLIGVMIAFLLSALVTYIKKLKNCACCENFKKKEIKLDKVEDLKHE